MLLALPALTLAVERDLAVQLHPRHINAQQFFPGGVALSRGQVRLFVHDMLEVIHHGAIRDKGQRTGQVAVQELAGILAKEALRQAKNSIDMEWTSHPSMLGHTVEYGTRSRLVYAAKA